MKILFIVTQSELGGAQRWIFDTATHLDKNKYQIAVASGGNGPLSANLQQKNITVFRLKYLARNISPFTDFFSLLEIYRLIKKEKPGILQLCSTKAGFLGSISGKLAHVPKIVYRIGGWSFNDPRPRWQNLIFLWLEKLTAPFKDKIIVNSQYDFNQAIKLKICPKEKLILIYNGINLEEISNASVFSNDETHLIKIGAIANNYPAKGLKYLYKAMDLIEKNNKLELLVIGKGTKIGPKDDPWQYFAEQGGIGIFVIPSLKEGVPYVLLEAMAAGLPIIATKVGGIPEIIADRKEGLLIPPANSEKIAEAIKTLAENQGLRKSLAQTAKETVKNFSLEKMIAKYSQLILNL